MTQSVELPLWLLVLILAFAAVAALTHVLVPSVRWFFRRRFFNAVDKLNARLQLHIQPFKLLRRHDTIDRLTHDPAVMEAVVDHARSTGVPLYVSLQQAGRYAREIVPSFSAFVYFGVATRLAGWVSRGLYRVRLGALDEAALGAVDPAATVVFVMNHRSNMDYVLVTWLASRRSALSYAVGEWAQVWPLRPLIRAMGGYFIRRRGLTPLYRRVLARYVQMATQGGVTQAIFPEGGLSQDGRLGPPRLGLLTFLVEGSAAPGARDVLFVPVGINYDRVAEDRVLSASGEGGRRRFRVGIRYALGQIARHLWLRLTRRFHGFGYACVGFGAPISLHGFLAREGRDEDAISRLGALLMQEVGRVVPALPVPVVAAVLLEAGPLPLAALEARTLARIVALRAAGAHVHLPQADPAEFVASGLRILARRGLVAEAPEGWQVQPGGAGLLRYYANSVAHLPVAEALSEAAAPA